MPYNFVLDIFHTKKLICSRLSSSEVRFYTVNGRFVFLSHPLGAYGQLRLIIHVMDFPSVNWTFSLGITAEVLRANIGSKSAISLHRGLNFRQKAHPAYSPTILLLRKLGYDLSYGRKMWTDLSFVLSQYTRLADRRTDAFLGLRPYSQRWHSMKRGKKTTMPSYKILNSYNILNISNILLTHKHTQHTQLHAQRNYKMLSYRRETAQQGAL